MLEAPTWWPSFSSSPWIRMSHPASRRRIRYSRRIDTAGHHARAPDRSRIRTTRRTSSLNFNGNARQAMEFYVSAFGGTLSLSTVR